MKRILPRRLLLCALLIGAAPLTLQAQERPNILLLTAEDLSPRIAAFGDPVALTPNLDRLAGLHAGVRLRDLPHTLRRSSERHKLFP